MKSHNRLSVLENWEVGMVAQCMLHGQPQSVATELKALGVTSVHPRGQSLENQWFLCIRAGGGSSGSRTENYNFLFLVLLILPWPSANWRVSSSLKAQSGNAFQTYLKQPSYYSCTQNHPSFTGWWAGNKCVCFSPRSHLHLTMVVVATEATSWAENSMHTCIECGEGDSAIQWEVGLEAT